MKVRKPYLERSEPREHLDFTGTESRTKQSFKDECDINHIMRRFLRGQMPTMKPGAIYGDFTSATDYLTATQIVENAWNEFNKLPAAVRSRFQNDPFELLEFVGNADNREEAIKIGLITPPAATPGPAPELKPDEKGKT